MLPTSGPTRELLPGVTLTRSTLGGYSVEYNGKYVGWIHASVGDRWNAYIRATTPNSGSGGIPIGTFTQLEAVRAIARRAGWTG